MDSNSLNNNNNKISFTTSQVEELWSQLLQAWPAVKNNPEIAEKIEKLWDILKNAGDDPSTINREIQNLLDNESSSGIITADSQHTSTQDDQDLDSLLAEILGENYQNEIYNAPLEKNTDGEATTSINAGTAELDKLVADILGDDWINEETSATSPSSINDDQITKSDSNIDSLVYSIIGNDLNNEINKPDTPNFNSESQKLIDDKQDIDQLLNEILDEDKINESSTNDINNSEENIDELINGILTEETDVIETTSSLNSLSNDEQTQITGSAAEEENIDDLINGILTNETDIVEATSSLNSLTNDEQTQITGSAAEEENIDDLINGILTNETDIVEATSGLNSLTNDEQTQITGSAAEEENVDDLINGILTNETDIVEATSGLNSLTNDEQTQITGSAAEENIDDLINDILEDKTNINSVTDNDVEIERKEIQPNKDNTSYQADNSQVLKNKPEIQQTRKTEKTNYKQPEKKSSNLLLIILLLLLILGFIAAWQLFFNKKSISDTEVTTEQKMDTSPFVEDDIVVSEPSVAEPEQIETKPEYTPPKYTAPVVEYKPTVPDYSENVDDKDDITLTLNSPETAIDSSIDSTIFNESGMDSIIEQEPLQDKNNSTENIPEQSPLTDADKEKEIALKNKDIKKKVPVKTVAKRKVIIHRIVKGDTLWAIAKRYVNNPYRYPELAKLSKIKNPNRIYPGNKVRIIIYIK